MTTAMRTPLRFTLSALLLFSFVFAQAQPKDDLPKYGCHYAKNQIPLHALSDAEKALVCGSNARSDSIDILNYAVTLDVTNFAQKVITANCEISLTAKEDGIEAVPLDLLDLTVDSVTGPSGPLSFDHDGLLLNVALITPLDIGDTTTVTVHYHGQPTADPSGFGGMVFDGNIAYNLGIGLSSNPFNFGRSWHPCFDNFVERATYDINIVSNGGRKGYAVGEFLGQASLGGDTIVRQYRMNLPLPTYLVGSATSNYVEVNDMHSGAYGDYPILLAGKAPDSSDMVSAFTYLGDAVDALEAWYGPYIWGQVGYVMTTRGAMEHASLIAFPDFSIGGGPTFNMNRLMAHELAHHWWGNITTLNCPENMWIKEGNAEYGSHLFAEYTFGKDYFTGVVKNNHYDVLKYAHLDDGGNYLALSPMPYEYTYGTHTYNKGASVMHNLRGYLGDTLFSQGMTSILETYGLEAVDAELFRDQLTANTGVDMTSFFDDWIYSPGYAAYELDSVNLEPTPVPEEYLATVFVQQKLHHAPHFHTNIPLEITFFDENWNTYSATIMASGEYSTATVPVPFQPVWQVLNDGNVLNLARMQDRNVVHEPGGMDLSFTGLINLEAKTVPDSALVSLIHYWVAPDPIVPNPNDVKISSTHYWRFGGIIPAGFRAKTTIQYRGANENDFDYDLTNGNEDSLILVWRPRPGVPWGEYPFYEVISIGSTTDGNGFIRVDTLLPGDYALAKGYLDMATATVEVDAFADVNVFPNPATGAFTVEGVMPDTGPVTLRLFDAMGRVLKTETVQPSGTHFTHRLETDGLPPGMYWLRIGSLAGENYGVRKVLLISR
jgi:peptidase M1-like protein/type IX secretion system substrate protein